MKKKFNQFKEIIERASNPKNLPFPTTFTKESQAEYARQTLYEFFRDASSIGIHPENKPVFSRKGNVLITKKKEKIEFVILPQTNELTE